MTNDRRRVPRLAQLFYSGLGGHGDVAFGIAEADGNGAFEHVMGFLGIEPLLPAYAERCDRNGYARTYIRAEAGRPWRSWGKIYRWLKETRPDFLLLHSPPALLPCLAYARRHRMPLIMVEHQPNVLKRKSEWVATRLGMRWADRVVLLTPQYQEEMRARLGWRFRSEKVRVIPNGVSTRLFHPADARPTGTGRTVVGMAARFTKAKRFDLAVDTLAELIGRRPDVNWRLTLAGGGEEWEAVKARAAAAGLADRVELPGTLEKPALADWFRKVDLYIHITEGETMSMSILQAMASELPICASRVRGVDAVLPADDSLGLLVAPQTSSAFAEALIALNDDPARAGAMAEHARQACVQGFSDTHMFDQYQKVLAEFPQSKA